MKVKLKKGGEPILITGVDFDYENEVNTHVFAGGTVYFFDEIESFI